MGSCAARRMFATALVTVLTATTSLAQSPPAEPGNRVRVSALVDSLHYDHPKFTSWDPLAQIDPGGKLFVTTVANPAHRHSCAAHSFTATELVCKGSFGSLHSYKVQDIAALIVPGDFKARVGLGIGFTAATAVVAWRAFVLAATCTPCAVGVVIGAFLLFVIDIGLQAADPVNDAVLYLAPGQTLQVKLRM